MSTVIENDVYYPLPDEFFSRKGANILVRVFIKKFKELCIEFIEGKGHRRKKHLEKLDECLSGALFLFEGDFRSILMPIDEDDLISFLTQISLKDPVKYFQFAVACLSSKFEALKYVVTCHSPTLMYGVAGRGGNPDKMIQMAQRCGILETLFHSLHEFPSPVLRFIGSKKQSAMMRKNGKHMVHIPRNHTFRSIQRENALSRAVCLDCHQYAFHYVIKRNFPRKKLIKSTYLRKIVLKLCERFLILKDCLIPKRVDPNHFDSFRKKRETAGFLLLNFSEGPEREMSKMNAKAVFTRFVEFLNEKQSLGLMKDTTYFKDIFFSILTNALSHFYLISREDSSKLRVFEDIIKTSSLSTTLFNHLVRDKGKSSIQVHLKILALLQQVFMFSNPEKERFKARNDATEVLAHLLVYYHCIPKIKSKEVERSLFFRITAIRAILGNFFEGLTHTPESTLSLTRVQNITVIGRSENHAGNVQGVARKVEERIDQLLKDRNIDSNFGGLFNSVLENAPENGTVPIARGRSVFNSDSLNLKTATTIPESNFEELDKNVGTRQMGADPNAQSISGCSSCGKRGKMRACGVCRVGLYCSVECQKKDWISHKKECKEWAKMRKLRKKMRKVKDKPTIGREKMDFCSVCGKSARFKCTRCKSKFYCCRECQVKDWKIHKVYCKI